MLAYDHDGISLYHANCLDLLPTLEPGGIDAVITSPPYWGGIRDYGGAGQIGLERNPADYIESLLGVFRACRRLLKEGGTLWLNLGDVYAASGKGGGGSAGNRPAWESVRERKGFRMPPAGYKMKDLTLIPFQVADVMRKDGWYLRSAIIWKKAAAVEPMRADRPAVSHEYLFLLSNSEVYQAFVPDEPWWGHTVWEVRSGGVKGHPAAMPLELCRRCIKVSVPPGGLVLDPFAGAGSTLVAAHKHGRKAIGIELSGQYIPVAIGRLRSVETPLLAGLD